MKLSRVFVYSRVFSFLTAHLVFITFVLARVEGSIPGWSWTVIFSPLLAIDALSVLFYLIYLVGHFKGHSYCYHGNQSRLFSVLVIPLGLLLKVASEILLTLHLDLSISFVPFGVLLSCLFTTLFIAMTFYTFKHNIHFSSLNN